MAEPRDARFPVALTTGRLRDQWHGMSRTGTLGRLFAHAGEPVVEMHPQELHRRRLNAGDLVRISSRRGDAGVAGAGPARPSRRPRPSSPCTGAASSSAATGVNALTSPATCPQSMQPELKHAAVRIEPAALPWQIAAAAWLPADAALAARERLRALFDCFGFVSCVPFGREPDARLGVRLRAALPAAADRGLAGGIEAALPLAEGPVLRYADVRAGQRRALRLQPDGTLQAFLLAGDTAAEAWVLALLQQRQPAAAFGRALLAASRQPPQPVARRSPQVCACHDVSEARIVELLRSVAGRRCRRAVGAAEPAALRHRMRLLPAGAEGTGAATSSRASRAA